MSYVDGFVAPIPKDKLEEYRKLAELACQVWMEHGALEYKEYITDDVPDGEVTSFPMSVKLKDDELISFAYARYESREHRDDVMKKVMADERMKCMIPEDMPFDACVVLHRYCFLLLLTQLFALSAEVLFTVMGSAKVSVR